MNVVSDKDLQKWLSNHEDWQLVEDTLVMEAEFVDFVTAFGFITSVAILAEKHNHHPTIESSYNLVRLSMNTHDEDDKITDKDLKLAEAIDKL